MEPRVVRKGSCLAKRGPSCTRLVIVIDILHNLGIFLTVEVEANIVEDKVSSLRPPKVTGGAVVLNGCLKCCCCCFSVAVVLNLSLRVSDNQVITPVPSRLTVTVVHGSVLDVLLHDAHPPLVVDDHQHDGHPGHEEDG